MTLRVAKNSTFVFFDGFAWTPRLRSPSPIMAPGTHPPSPPLPTPSRGSTAPIRSVFHSFHGLMNSINWPASSVWVFIAQLGEHCSANAEATGSNPVEALKIFFSGYLLRWSHIHFLHFEYREDTGDEVEPNCILGKSKWRTFMLFFFEFLVYREVNLAV